MNRVLVALCKDTWELWWHCQDLTKYTGASGLAVLLLPCKIQPNAIVRVSDNSVWHPIVYSLLNKATEQKSLCLIMPLRQQCFSIHSGEWLWVMATWHLIRKFGLFQSAWVLPFVYSLLTHNRNTFWAFYFHLPSTLFMVCMCVYWNTTLFF